VAVYKDVARVVDLYLRGEEYFPEMRQVDHGEIVTEDEVIYWSDQYDQSSSICSDSITSIFPFAINKENLFASIRDLNVGADVSQNIAQADLLLTTSNQLKKNQKVKSLVKSHQIPVHVISSNSQKCIQAFLRDYFELDTSDESVHEDVLNEIRQVCERVIAEQRTLDAAPRTAYERRIQHRFVSDSKLSSLSIGEEPNRRVRVYPPVAGTK
jgi:hypothetical protein